MSPESGSSQDSHNVGSNTYCYNPQGTVNNNHPTPGTSGRTSRSGSKPKQKGGGSRVTKSTKAKQKRAPKKNILQCPICEFITYDR